jgi:holo-[acyl-carrier protein] synthase
MVLYVGLLRVDSPIATRGEFAKASRPRPRSRSQYGSSHKSRANFSMPLRPFPYALRVGTDICNVARVRQMLARKGDNLTYLGKFTRRILTVPERVYFWQRFGPSRDIPTKLDAVSEFLAGRFVAIQCGSAILSHVRRFAAKEAIRKACDHFEETARGYQSIVILPITPSTLLEHHSSRPQGLILDTPYGPTPVAHRNLYDPSVSSVISEEMSITADDLDGQLCEISISHDGDFATAVALVPSTDRLQRTQGV